jgi:hypothetical protein
MRDEPVSTLEYKGFTIETYYDDSPESPREWSNLGTMACWHGRYSLGDKHSFDDADELLRSLLEEAMGDYDKAEKEYERADSATETSREFHDELLDTLSKKFLILPIFMYDHSGIALSTGGFSDPWDSGQVGFIYVSHETLRKEYSVKRVGRRTLRTAEKILKGEVEVYGKYVNGEVYGYITKDSDDENIDSCWGYYGNDADNDSYMISEAKSHIDYEIKKRKAKAKEEKKLRDEAARQGIQTIA